ncbi:MAG: CYTH domain-containing protein [Myxococcota bacterium]
MGKEIERKFLVSADHWREGATGTHFQQGYLTTDPDRTVRVRIAGEKAKLTIKGRSVGATRAEFEYPIPVEDAQQLLAMCTPPNIEKTRYKIQHEGYTWEVDVFEGVNAGLIVAEVELQSEEEQPPIPDWIGAEVTEDRRYYNANLIAQPYSTWD